MGCDHFLRRTHAPCTSRFQCARTRVCTFILWWSHFATALRTLLKIKFRGYFYKKKACTKYGRYNRHFCLKRTVSEIWFFCLLTSYIYSKKNCVCKKNKKKEKIWLFSNKIRKISNFCLKSGQNVWSHVCGVWPAQKWSRAHTSHTCFKSLFAGTRTRATAHRTCACAHAPSQPMPWSFNRDFFNIMKRPGRLIEIFPTNRKGQVVKLRFFKK